MWLGLKIYVYIMMLQHKTQPFLQPFTNNNNVKTNKQIKNHNSALGL